MDSMAALGGCAGQLNSFWRWRLISIRFDAVSKAGKSVAGPADGLAQVPFEEALNRLGSVVEAMERDDLPLDELLSRFEEGTRLARHCQEQLSAAEVKISQLEQSAAGELVTTPLAVATAQ